MRIIPDESEVKQARQWTLFKFVLLIVLGLSYASLYQLHHFHL